MDRTTSVLVVDDHTVVREGLKLILEREFPGVVIGEAQNAAQLLVQVHNRRWDLLILDLSMPGKGALEVLREVKQLRPDLRILILSIYPESPFAARTLRAGAHGYISKDSSRDELIRAIRSVLGGEKYISNQLAGTIASGLAGESQQPPHELLSGREYEVMLAIAAGRAGTEIARDLSVSTKTVSTYRRRVLVKMSMNTNADLTRYVLEQKLLSLGTLIIPIGWIMPWTDTLLDLL